jgi:hypothetical protein
MEQHDNQHQVNRSCLGLIENFIVLKAQGVTIRSQEDNNNFG